jgi:coenzyme F420-dependent glucose-6-phosphate dehydrogenase
LVTNEIDADKIKNKLFPALKEGARLAGKDYESLEKVLFIPASYDEDKEKAIESIGFWKGSMIKAFYEVDVHDPRKIEENGQLVGNDVIERMALVISNAEEGIKKLKKYVDLGFTEIVLTNSSPNRKKFVKLLTEELAPEFKRKGVSKI